jgi:type IV pilus assembly protein PilM
MAHKILGIDLGTYSVKVVELMAGFRQAHLSGVYEKVLLPPEEGEGEGESHLDRAARTAAALIAEERLHAEMHATSMGGDAMLRLITMPFSDKRKIEQVLGYELESQILGDLEGLVLDSVIASSRESSTNVIAVAAEREHVRAVIEALERVGAEPKVVGAAALSYAALPGTIFPASEEVHVVVDIGHRHTHVCMVQRETALFARSIPRGSEELTLAIAETFHLDFGAAERLKHEQVTLLEEGAATPSPGHRRMDACLREALRPLVRELRQTLAAYRAIGEPIPEQLFLTGGGARLSGIDDLLSAELGLPVRPITIENKEFIASEAQGLEEGMQLPAQALGLALAAAAPVPQVNLRRGELSFRNDYSFVRGKAAYLVAAMLAILAFAAVNAVASLRALRKEADVLETRLRRDTIELFGSPKLDGKAVSEELRQGPRGGAPPVPAVTAYDVLDEISQHVPPADKGKLDVSELDIKPKKVFIKATAESAQQVDDLAAALSKIDCFEDVQKGKLSSVTQTSGDGKVELKQFTLTITTTCP